MDQVNSGYIHADSEKILVSSTAVVHERAQGGLRVRCINTRNSCWDRVPTTVVPRVVVRWSMEDRFILWSLLRTSISISSVTASVPDTRKHGVTAWCLWCGFERKHARGTCTTQNLYARNYANARDVAHGCFALRGGGEKNLGGFCQPWACAQVKVHSISSDFLPEHAV